MMRCDAEWLGRTLAELSTEELSPLLNLGASTRHFREVEQPHVNELVFRPLEARGVKVIHSDLKAADGVDLVGDVFDDADFAKLKAVKPRSVICTHMFEHVIDREELSRRLLALLPGQGLFFVTVPSSYHEHNDPIDTMYRPTPDELASLFAGQQILHKSELIGDTYWSHVARRPLTIFFRHFSRFFLPFLGLKAWKRSMHKLYWLFHNYKVAAIVGRKTA
jgi:methyltransferase family protein